MATCFVVKTGLVMETGLVVAGTVWVMAESVLVLAASAGCSIAVSAGLGMAAGRGDGNTGEDDTGEAKGEVSVWRPIPLLSLCRICPP